MLSVVIDAIGGGNAGLAIAIDDVVFAVAAVAFVDEVAVDVVGLVPDDEVSFTTSQCWVLVF